MALKKPKYDYLLKLIIIGDSSVGKTCLLQRYTQNSFNPQYVPTVFENLQHQEVVDGQSVSLEIVDTAGQEEYSAMRDQYMRTGQGFLCVYSITNKATFEEIANFFIIAKRLKVPFDDLDDSHIGRMISDGKDDSFFLFTFLDISFQ